MNKRTVLIIGSIVNETEQFSALEKGNPLLIAASDLEVITKQVNELMQQQNYRPDDENPIEDNNRNPTRILHYIQN